MWFGFPFLPLDFGVLTGSFSPYKCVDFVQQALPGPSGPVTLGLLTWACALCKHITAKWSWFFSLLFMAFCKLKWEQEEKSSWPLQFQHGKFYICAFLCLPAISLELMWAALPLLPPSLAVGLRKKKNSCGCGCGDALVATYWCHLSFEFYFRPPCEWTQCTENWCV